MKDFFVRSAMVLALVLFAIPTFALEDTFPVKDNDINEIDDNVVMKK